MSDLTALFFMLALVLCGCAARSQADIEITGAVAYEIDADWIWSSEPLRALVLELHR